jgi:CRP-like cAMP-binding protein
MFNPSIQRVGITRSYAPKREIVSEDDPANRVYEVISGTVCTYKMLREGRRQISVFYFPGEVFGLESASMNAAINASDAHIGISGRPIRAFAVSTDNEGGFVSDQ